MGTRDSSRRARLVRWVGAGLVLVLLAVVVREVDGESVKRALARVDLRWAPLLVLLLALNFLIRSWRWRYLLGGGRRLPVGPLAEATTVGFMSSFLLPFRAGEVVRPWLLSRWRPVRFGTAVASIVIERVTDGLTVIGLLALAAARWRESPEWLEAGARMLGLVAAAGLGMMVLAYAFSAPFTRWAQRLVDLLVPARLDAWRLRLHHLVDGFFSGLKAIRSLRQLLLVILGSVALWLELAVFYQAGLRMMGLELPFAAGLSVTVLVALAIAAPGPPGFLGTFQIGCIAALGLHGIGRGDALSFSIVMHLGQAACIVPAGLWVLHHRGLGFREALPWSVTAQDGSSATGAPSSSTRIADKPGVSRKAADS